VVSSDEPPLGLHSPQRNSTKNMDRDKSHIRMTSIKNKRINLFTGTTYLKMLMKHHEHYLETE